MEIITYPPVTFILSLVVVLFFGWLIKPFEPKVLHNPERSKTYACGEDFPAQKLSPSYEEFYPYAIFFTVLHVVVLMLMTLAFSTSVSFVVPVIYLAVVVLVLTIIFILR